MPSNNPTIRPFANPSILFPAISRFCLYALIVFAPLARGAVQPWAVTVIHLFTLAALTAALLERAAAGTWQWVPTPLDRPFPVLWALALACAALSVHPATSREALLLLADYTAVFYLVVHVFRTLDQRRNLVRVIVAVGLFLAIFGIVKRFGANPFPWWDYPELHYPRSFMAATYGNHNHLAGYLEMALPLALGCFVRGYRGGLRLLMLYLVLILATALVLTLSRGGWIAASAGLAFMAWALARSRHYFHKRLLAAGVSAGLVLALVILASTPVVARIRTVAEADESASLASRITAWTGVVDLIKDRPWAGAGPGTFALAFTRYQPPGLNSRFTQAHNDYLQFAAELGLAVFPLLAWMAVALFRRGLKRLDHPSRRVRGIVLGALGGIVAVGGHALVDFNLHIPANALVFAVLAALAVAPERQYCRCTPGIEAGTDAAD